MWHFECTRFVLDLHSLCISNVFVLLIFAYVLFYYCICVQSVLFPYCARSVHVLYEAWIRRELTWIRVASLFVQYCFVDRMLCSYSVDVVIVMC